MKPLRSWESGDTVASSVAAVVVGGGVDEMRFDNPRVACSSKTAGD